MKTCYITVLKNINKKDKHIKNKYINTNDSVIVSTINTIINISITITT
jgi:hypothetical protein